MDVLPVDVVGRDELKVFDGRNLGVGTSGVLKQDQAAATGYDRHERCALTRTEAASALRLGGVP